MDLNEIDLDTLTDKERMQLAAFHRCYNTHTPALTWRQLKAEGLERIEKAKCGLTEVEEGLKDMNIFSSFTFMEDTDTVTDGEGRAFEMKDDPDQMNWLERRKAQWVLDTRDKRTR